MRRHHPAVGEGHLLRAGLVDRHAQRDLDAAPLEDLLRAAAEFVAQLGHQLGRDVDQVPLDQAGVQPWIALHGRVRQPLQTGRGLGARVAAADHHELQPRGLLGRVVAGVRQVELRDDVVADVGGLGEGLHPEGVLGQARDVEGAGHAARGQHDVVVGLVDDLVGDGADDAHLGLQVHADRTARDDPGAVLLAAAQGQGDRLRREHAGGDLGQQRQIELVGEWRHQRDVGLVEAEFPLQAADASDSGEACANHQDPGSCHVVHPFLRLQAVRLDAVRMPWIALRQLRSHRASSRSASWVRQADERVGTSMPPPGVE